MISQVRGSLADKDGDLVTVMTASGVGYEISMPATVIGRLPPIGTEVTIHTVLVVREDDMSLFGFDDAYERSVFQRLLQANGVGPRLALGMISALTGERVVRAVREGDLAALCTVSGVGKKKAERMVLELKDRMSDLGGASSPELPGPLATQAVTALVRLGYQTSAAETAVRKAMATEGTDDTSDIVRVALQHIAKN
jgi:Holliday junction DNA helicase RuvA